MAHKWSGFNQYILLLMDNTLHDAEYAPQYNSQGHGTVQAEELPIVFPCNSCITGI